MVLFRPDFVIFSAGFDAHDDDDMASCELTEDDYKWATEIGVLCTSNYSTYACTLLITICVLDFMESWSFPIVIFVFSRYPALYVFFGSTYIIIILKTII